MGVTSVPAYVCDRCQHVWLPRIKIKEPPIICPKCKSYYWNKPTRQELSKPQYIELKLNVFPYNILGLLITDPEYLDMIAYKLGKSGKNISNLLHKLEKEKLVFLNPNTSRYEITQKGRTEYKLRDSSIVVMQEEFSNPLRQNLSKLADPSVMRQMFAKAKSPVELKKMLKEQQASPDPKTHEIHITKNGRTKYSKLKNTNTAKKEKS